MYFALNPIPIPTEVRNCSTEHQTKMILSPAQPHLLSLTGPHIYIHYLVLNTFSQTINYLDQFACVCVCMYVCTHMHVLSSVSLPTYEELDPFPKY